MYERVSVYVECIERAYRVAMEIGYQILSPLSILTFIQLDGLCHQQVDYYQRAHSQHMYTNRPATSPLNMMEYLLKDVECKLVYFNLSSRPSLAESCACLARRPAQPALPWVQC